MAKEKKTTNCKTCDKRFSYIQVQLPRLYCSIQCSRVKAKRTMWLQSRWSE
jgi:endogenous inhibitor of DNA gyrase (YacG/DUF329 family)